MLFICDQRLTQALSQMVNQRVTSKEIVSIFTVERFEAFVGVARLEKELSALVSGGSSGRSIVRGKPDLFKHCNDLCKHLKAVLLPYIDRGNKLTAILGNALLPGLSIDPNGINRTPIDPSNLQRLLHMARGSCLGRSDQEDDLSGTNSRLQRFFGVLHPLFVKHAVA